jgi:hypothetical protein
MVVLDQASQPSPIRFVVPEVLPGKFLVVIYDGSEGGHHYTWDTFTVTAGSPDPELARDDEAEGLSTRWFVAIALVVAGAGAGWVFGSSRR